MDYTVVSWGGSLYLDNGSVSCSTDNQHCVLQNASRRLPRTSSLEDLSLSGCSIWKCQADNLVISGEFDLVWSASDGDVDVEE